ncbi:MAG: Sensor histidine kinase RegB [Gammaproteobacteria bacterium]|nr:Sensor histidine kinase RegB [Gammaproteobacteria bacterium]
MILTSLCLRYLLLLRAIAMGGQVLALVAVQLLPGTTVPWLPIAIVMGVLAAFTIRSWRGMRAGRQITEAVVMRQLCVDIAALAVLLYFTGGSRNPFVSLFLLPITVAAATLRPAYTWLLAAAAAGCYTLLMFYHRQTLQWVHDGDHFALHLWGMWLGFLLSAGIVAFFVARIGATLRAHDRELAGARQMMALGTLAAGAAHELGTPLATMAVLARELQHDLNDEKALREGLTLLRTQVDRCKEILGRMAAQAGERRAEGGARTTIDRYLEAVVREWRVLRPEVQAMVKLDGPQPAPAILADRTVTQALINVLNNAADASPANVEVAGHWDAGKLKIEVRDRGAGVPPGLAGEIGKAFVTTKAEGMGLGLYIARTTLGRLGGHVELRNRGDGRGAVASIDLPLAGLSA